MSNLFSEREILLQVNSRDRNNYSSTTSSDFTVNMGMDYKIQEASAVAVKDIQMVNSFYNVDTYNNTLYYDTGGGELSITLDPGMYRVEPYGSSNWTEITAALVSAFGLAGITVTVSLNTATNKLSWTSAPAISFYDTRADGSRNPLAYLLGILGGTPGAPVGVYNSEGMPDLSGVKSVYIMSNILAGGACRSSRKTTGNSGGAHLSLLDTVPVNVAFGAVIHHDASDFELDRHIYDRVLNNSLASIDIRIEDSEGNVLDTNGHDVVIVLKLYY